MREMDWNGNWESLVISLGANKVHSPRSLRHKRGLLERMTSLRRPNYEASSAAKGFISCPASFSVQNQPWIHRSEAH